MLKYFRKSSKYFSYVTKTNISNGYIPLLLNQSANSMKNQLGNGKRDFMKNSLNKYGCTFYFSTSTDKKDAYTKTGQQKQIKQPHNLQKQNTKALKFINRLRQYSNFLGNKNANKQNIINNIQINMVEKINQNFIIAGTNNQQISKNLNDIADKLQQMYLQSQALYQKHKDSQDKKLQQKYRARYEEFIKLLQTLDQKHYREPSVSHIQPIQASLFFLDMQTQLTSLIQLLYGAIKEQSHPQFKFSKDITNDDAFSKTFQYAWNKIKIIELDKQTKTNHDMVYSLLRKSVIMVTNAVVTQHTFNDWQNQYWHKVLFGLSFPVSLANLQKAQLKCYKLWRNPKIQMVKHLLDLPEKGYIQHAKKIIYPSIKSNFFLYRHNAPQSKPDKKQTVQSKQVKAQQTTHSIFQKTDNSGRILLLSHSSLQWKGQMPQQKFAAIKKLFSFKKEQKKRQMNQKDMETIIVHMHGGGFISMSSQLMQNHTRKWANQLQVPVFSLDYRKPPRHRFPQPLQDCVAGYKFIVQKIHQYVNIRPKNIILAGDSAGGNMACALQAHLMKQKYPVLPKALFLMYPAVDLRVRYTPSRLQSFSDGIFLPSLLMLCQQQYLGKNRQTQFDPLASPILLTQGYINPENKDKPNSQKWPQNWPKTVIMAGRKDPLFDDSIRLLQRLARDGLDCKMLLYKDFSHGFMSMDQALPGCKQAINDSIAQLKQIIKQF